MALKMTEQTNTADRQRPELSAIKRGPLLSEMLQEEIKNYIIQNDLRPGDPLPSEGDFARQLGTSRNSVREAVKSLEALGVLEARSGSGLFVRAFTFDSIIKNLPYGLLFDEKSVADLVEVRAHLEYGMADRVIREVTREQLDVLQSIIERMHREAERGRYSSDDDRAFHEALYLNIDNLVLLEVLQIFWLVVVRARELSQVVDPTDPLETFKSHEGIYEALVHGSVEQMRAAFDHHYGRWPLRLQSGRRLGRTNAGG
jgi:DNA-binding FadR family transcriptional regulator